MDTGQRSKGFRQAIGIFALIIIGLLAACATSRIEELKHINAHLTKDESIVILPRRQHLGRGTEEDFIECLNETLAEGNKPLNTYPERAFIDRLFPWFEPRTAPSSVEALAQLLNRPKVSTRITEIGVRYLLWVDGYTESDDSGGSMGCTVGPFGGGCFGFVWWDKDSAYEVSIWDLKLAESVGTISANVTGKSYMPAVIVPIPLVSRTQGIACDGLAKQLKEFLTTEDY